MDTTFCKHDNNQCLGNFRKIQARQKYFWQWVVDLTKAMDEEFSDDKWEVLGHGLMIESKDPDQCEKYLQSICEFKRINFQVLDDSNLMELEAQFLQSTSLPTLYFIKNRNCYLHSLDDEESINKQKILKNYLNGSIRKPIFFVIASEAYTDIATQLRYEGLFDRHIKWVDPQPMFIAEDLIDDIGVDAFEHSLLESRERLGCLLCSEFSLSRRMGLLKAALRRIVHFENRKIGWLDFIRFAADGTGEGCEQLININYKKIAAHEAGHSLVTIIESGGHNIPDLTTILPGAGYVGMVMDDFVYINNSGRSLSYEESCIKLRIALAGRVAEEIIFGPFKVDIFFARDDLRFATKIAYDLVAKAGFSHDYGSSHFDGMSLLVSDDESNSVDSYYRDQARSLLAYQYLKVRSCLMENRVVLDKIIDALLNKKFLMQKDIKEIINTPKESALEAA